MDSKVLIFFLGLAVVAVSLKGAMCAPDAPGLAIASSETGKAYLTYKDAPLFAFGPGDELRTLSGGNDLARWAAWQQEHGMNLIRAYPVSVPLEFYNATGLDPFQKRGDQWDVDAFNSAYFDSLADGAAAMEKHDIVLHLQLWQIVFFKGGSARWDANYLNPANNVNEWTRALNRGKDYIDAPADSPARLHQRRWVEHILDAVKGRRNVFIDVINELGNEMGTIEWAVEVTRWIRAWEAANDWRFIVGVDSEHHYTPERFGPHREHFDLIILNELRTRRHALDVIAAFNMPAVSVRSSDGSNQWSDYLFARADQTGPEHQTRYRTLCYRSMFAGLQSVGAYWKPTIQDADYRDMEFWPVYAKALRAFWDYLAPYWPELAPDAEDKHIISAVTPHAHALVSPALMAVYLECGSHIWNNAYEASSLLLRCPFDAYEIIYFDPRTGVFKRLDASLEEAVLTVPLPAFIDDAVVLVVNK